VTRRLITLVLTALLASGCGGALSSAAAIHRSTQPARVDYYHARHMQCQAQEETLDAYRGCMRPARGIAAASDLLADALTEADRVQRSGGTPDLAALGGMVRGFVALLETAGMDVPAELRDLLEVLP
jgi:hypothetical protein